MDLVSLFRIVTLYLSIISSLMMKEINCISPIVNDESSRPLESRKGIHLIRTIAKKFEAEYTEKIIEFDPAPRVISPLSVFIPLLVLSYGARDDTRLKLIRSLGIPSLSTSLAKNGFHRLLHILNNYDLRMGTKIYYPSHLKPRLEFVDTASTYFHTTIESVDLNSGSISSTKINQWVAQETNNRHDIKLYEQHEVGPNPGIVIVYAIYFKGVWKSGFDSSLTKFRPFKVFNGETIDVMTMYKRGRYRYGEISELDSRFVKIPYKCNGPEDAVNMFVILPNKVDGYFKMIPKLREISLKGLDRNGSMKNVDLYLPKFKIETDISLSHWLPEFLGAANPFVSPINFTRMFHSTQMHLGPSRSKAVIEIDEEGDVSEQVSGLFYKTRSPRSSDLSETVEFRVNYPFIAIIATKGQIFLDLFTINFTGNKSYYASLVERRLFNNWTDH